MAGIYSILFRFFLLVCLSIPAFGEKYVRTVASGNVLRLACICCACLWCGALVAQPIKVWDRTLGGTGYDILLDIRQANDGGFIMGGNTQSPKSGDMSEGTRGVQDMWIVKLDGDGVKQWDKILGAGSAGLGSVIPTSDGGFLIGGYSNANAGGDKTENSKGGGDFWIVKLDADGTKLWDKTIGGTGPDGLIYMEETSDGGLILGGVSESGIGADKTTPNYGLQDYWIVKLDASGVIEWDQTIGSAFGDTFNSVQQASDGGYMVAGWTWAGVSGNKTSPQRGEEDFWVIKLDPDGNIEWDKTIGGSGSDYLNSMRQTTDGGFILSGASWSGISGDKTGLGKGMDDIWVVKLALNGTIQWDKTIGGSDSEESGTIIQVSDGGYVLGGTSMSGVTADKTESSKGFRDYWMVKLASDGSKLWDKAFGGSSNDVMRLFRQTSDDGFILGGYSVSPATGDKTQGVWGSIDFWLVKTSSETPFPVTLTRFEAQKEGNSTVLHWITTAETQSDRFEIEHSTNGKAWTVIGTTKAMAESAVTVQYYFTHTRPAPATYNMYRLKMIDRAADGVDGTYAYSKIVGIRFHLDTDAAIYPNPAREVLNIRMANWQNVRNVQLIDNSAIKIYDSGESPSDHIDLTDLKSGVYLVRITQDDGFTHSQKVVICR